MLLLCIHSWKQLHPALRTHMLIFIFYFSIHKIQLQLKFFHHGILCPSLFLLKFLLEI